VRVLVILRLIFVSADGIVRLYRNYDPTLEQGPLQMVSAFRGLNEIVQSRQGTGLVMDWKQTAGTLLLGGDSRVIKVWDAQTETQGLVRILLFPNDSYGL
jgi:regulator-associated protein of mTOR